jgi:hypothetical protein
MQELKSSILDVSNVTIIKESQEMFKYQNSKGVTGNRTTNKDRKYNGQKRQKNTKGQTMIYTILHRKLNI